MTLVVTRRSSTLKWPKHLAVIRHGQSAYNALRAQKNVDELYQEFLTSFNLNPHSDETIALARHVKSRFALTMSDYDTPLSEKGFAQANATGARLHEVIPTPDVVYISPYLRTRQTYEQIVAGGFSAGAARVIYEDRIREQEHGLSLLYSDWRVFHALHPEQHELHAMQGPYWYMYPQGESVSMVRDRLRLFFQTLVREHAGQNVLLISHHLTTLSIRANLERWTPEQFIDVDENAKPFNCGITHYECKEDQGTDGRLVLNEYNVKLYD